MYKLQSIGGARAASIAWRGEIAALGGETPVLGTPIFPPHNLHWRCAPGFAAGSCSQRTATGPGRGAGGKSSPPGPAGTYPASPRGPLCSLPEGVLVVRSKAAECGFETRSPHPAPATAKVSEEPIAGQRRAAVAKRPRPNLSICAGQRSSRPSGSDARSTASCPAVSCFRIREPAAAPPPSSQIPATSSLHLHSALSLSVANSVFCSALGDLLKARASWLRG